MADRHSSNVVFVKMTLSLGGLTLLALLLILSHAPDPTAALNTSSLEVDEHLQWQTLARPRYAGIIGEGQELRLAAETAVTGRDGSSIIDMQDVDAVLNLSDGDVLALSANQGEFDPDGQLVELRGSVIATTLSGVRLQSEAIDVSLEEMRMKSSSFISASGHSLMVEAGAMDLLVTRGSEQVYFSGGVRVQYDMSEGSE